MSYQRRLIAGAAMLLLPIAPALASAPAAAADQPARMIHFLVDVSGSMSTNDRIGAAKSAVTELVSGFDAASVGAGLRTFGVSGCDTSLNVTPGVLDKEAFLAAVAPLQATGATPLAAGLAAAASDLESVESASKSIVLLADGDNNCGGDPCMVARDIAASGTGLVVHAAGIQVDSGAASTLKCIADATGGSYVDVNDPTDLADVLGPVVGTRLRKAVVLGDSFSSGEGAYLYDQNQDCHRGSGSWGAQLEATYPTRIDVVANYACSGAKIEHLLNEEYRGQRPQVEQLADAIAKGNKVDLVLFTIGGNDAGFSTVITDCFLKNRYVDCASGRLKNARAIADRIKSQVQDELLPAIRKAVGPEADIVWIGYPRLFPSTQGEVKECAWLADNERAAVNSAVATITNRGFAFDDETDAYFTGSFPVFAGQELCAETSLFNPVLGKPKFAPEQAHPTREGYRIWAEYLYAQLAARGLL